MLFTDSSAKHMLVIRNGHMYIFDAIDKDGRMTISCFIVKHLMVIFPTSLCKILSQNMTMLYPNLCYKGTGCASN